MPPAEKEKSLYEEYMASRQALELSAFTLFSFSGPAVVCVVRVGNVACCSRACRHREGLAWTCRRTLRDVLFHPESLRQ